MISGLRSVATGSIGLAAVLVLAGLPIWAASLDVQVPEPTGDPSADNQYNVTVFGDAMGEPWNPGDTVSLGSSTEINGKKLSEAAGAQNWTKPASAPAAPAVKNDLDRGLGGDGSQGGSSGATTR